MKGEIHYRETWPKELRIKIENEDELNFLRLIFANSPDIHLKKYKVVDLQAIGKDNSWRKTYTEKYQQAELSDEEGPYTTLNVCFALEEEKHNMLVLEDVSDKNI